ncbi:MAG: methyltransferase domain-containing protein [Candidatus Sericytochromatia bacterium]|nr:methyltransferase domain-containing protein [Candidatus Sericytochromatia bacterium]
MTLDAPDPRVVGLPAHGTRRLIVAGPGWAPACAALQPATVCPPEDVSRHPPAGSDTVSLLGVLAAVPDPTALLDAAVALLAPGGVLVLAEHTVERPEDLHAQPGCWPPFRRWQLGSVLQGYGLRELAFAPMTLPAGGSVMRVWGWRP